MTAHTSTPADDYAPAYARIADMSASLKAIDEARELLRRAMHREIHEVFPENHGQRRRQGMVSDVVARSGYTREYVAKIRDKDIEPAPEQDWRTVLRTAL